MREKKITWKHILAIIVVILVAIYCIVAFYFRDKFMPGTKISGVSVSGKTVSAVTKIFEGKAEKYSLTIKERKGKEETLTNEQMKPQFVGKDDIEKIKSGQNSFAWIAGLFGGESYDDEKLFSYDQDSYLTASKKLNCLDKKQMIKRVNAKPVYKDGKFVIQKEEEGTQIKTEVMSDKMDEYIRAGITTIDLDKEGCYYNPEYTSDNKKVIALNEKMDKAAKGSITYKFGKQTVVLDPTIYQTWYKIKDDYSDFTINNDKLDNWLLSFMYKYNTQYGWHKFKTHDGRTKKVYGGPYGWRISKDKEMAAITKMLKEGTTETREPHWRAKGKVYDGVNGDIGDTYFEVDISAQSVYYYRDGKLKFQTSCVTGKMTADRKTPECVAYILYKQPSATLNGQGYSSPVKYWMPFIGNVGFHSASWRSSFGGSEYISNGSHGCINLPSSSAATLYSYAKQGDPVVVYY